MKLETNEEDSTYCYYSDLPSPMAYMALEETEKPVQINYEKNKLTEQDINRIIEMAWEDRTPFDAIEFQFGLKESDVKALMKSQLKFSSYKLWRVRVENCKTKHAKQRVDGMNRFKCNLQRNITKNKISKRK
jgi:uncharacterized protein (TIGR03643 family)